jgi:hypothetical protein
MNQDELYDALQEGLTIFKLQSLRSDIRRHTGLYVPNRPTEVAEWYGQKKSVLSRKANPANETGVTDDTEPSQSNDDQPPSDQ